MDSQGFGREIASLANDEDADADSLGCISPARRAATAPALQVQLASSSS